MQLMAAGAVLLPKVRGDARVHLEVLPVQPDGGLHSVQMPQVRCDVCEPLPDRLPPQYTKASRHRG